MPTPISPASEFPNDNPRLHDGVIWVCASPCAGATAELPARVAEDDDEADEIEIVDEIELDIVDDLEPAEVIVGAATSDVALQSEDDGENDVEDDAAEDDETDDAEVDAAEASEDDANDPFSFYVQTMTDVMIAAGGSDAAPHLVAALSEEPTARAWRRIMTGESEDFAACGAQSLDEWSAELVARLIAMPAKTDQLRRELRARGVAAFGLVVA